MKFEKFDQTSTRTPALQKDHLDLFNCGPVTISGPANAIDERHLTSVD